MRLIDADNLVRFLTSPIGFKTICEDCCDIHCLECIVENVIKIAPTVDVETVKHGKWIEKPYLLGTTRYCSLCGKNYGMPHGIYDYCPNCGAKMKSEE